MKARHYKYFYFFVFALSCLLYLPHLVSRGMFADGLQYAAIARNLSMGLGSPFHLHLTETLFPYFYEHPPLAFFLESFFFTLFGDGYFTERIYCITCYIIVLIFIVLIWKTLTKSLKTAWLPMLFFIVTPVISWSFGNNMLENTMSVFTTASMYLLIKAHQNKQKLFLVLAGFNLFLAVLSKGLVALYLWTFPAFYFLFFERFDWKTAIVNTLLFVLYTLLPLAILCTLSANAWQYFNDYFNKQILGSIANENTVGTRFFIVIRCFTELLISLILFVSLKFAFKRKTIDDKLGKPLLQWSKLFLSMALCGVIPIMISLKQSGFYILTTYPLFAIALALPLYWQLKNWLETYPNSRYLKWIKIVSVLIITIAIINTIRVYHLQLRDKEKLFLLDESLKFITPKTTIGIAPGIYNDWAMHGYFARYANINLDPNINIRHTYYIAFKTDVTDTALLQPKVVTEHYVLYEWVK